MGQLTGLYFKLISNYFHFISDSPASFKSEVQDFVKDLYNSVQIEMAKKRYYHRDLDKEFNPYELT